MDVGEGGVQLDAWSMDSKADVMAVLRACRGLSALDGGRNMVAQQASARLLGEREWF